MRTKFAWAAPAALLLMGACLAAVPADGASAAQAAGAPAAGAPAAGAPPAGDGAAPDLRALIAEYASDSRSVRDFYTIDRSPTRLAREEALDAAWAARLEALPFDALDTEGRIDWLLLRNELLHGARRRAATRAKLDETAPLVPFAAEIIALEEARWRLAPVDPEAAATQLDALAKSIKSVKERVEKGKAAKPGADAVDPDPGAAPPDPGAPAQDHDHSHTPWHVRSNLSCWFLAAQRADGSWPGETAADRSLDVPATALAVLSLMGAGNAHTVTGRFPEACRKGLRFLLDAQQPGGGFGAPVTHYGDAAATLALVKAWTLTHDEPLRAPAEKALHHLADVRGRGRLWRESGSRPDDQLREGDAWTTGWAMLALALARDSDLAYDAEAHADALARLQELTDPATGITCDEGRVRQPVPGESPAGEISAEAAAWTAVAVVSRLFDDPDAAKPGNMELVRKGADALGRLELLPDDAHPDRRDVHFWFFGTTAFYLAGGPSWKTWEAALIPAFKERQQTSGELKGSWDPTSDRWTTSGGRLISTALLSMTMEVFFRYDTWLGPKPGAPLYPAFPRTSLSAPRAGDAPAAPSEASGDPPLTATPVVARRAAAEIGGLRRALDTWFEHYDEFSPGFSWWARKPCDAVNAALDEYGKLLREEVAGLKGKDEDPLVGDPIGREALVDDLAAEMIDYTPEELLAIGERELAWCEAEMRKAAADMGLGDDWKAALARVKDDHVPPGEQDALVVAQSREAIEFLDAHDLVTIPELCRETWRVRMIGADTQRTLPYAAYGGQDMLVAYPTRDMDQETKLMTMRGNNVRFSRIVVPHELIPGHHLQGFMAARSRTHRGMFGTPFLGEGWALYWEMRLWELGWPRGPEDRIGMLFWRMHRAARIIVSLKFHLGQMQPQEMIDFLVERVGHEKAGATSEVRRYVGGSYGPLYQCAYMIGGLQLRALHGELVGAGARWTERQFHDAVLAQNSMPVKLIRAALLAGSGAPELTRDGPPAWRFAGDP